MNLNVLKISFFLMLMFALLIMASTTKDLVYRDLFAGIMIITGALCSKFLSNKNANN